MAPAGRPRDIVASRRRRADEGEEDEAGSFYDDSHSEASALSVANGSPHEEDRMERGENQAFDTSSHKSRTSPNETRDGPIKPLQPMTEGTNRESSAAIFSSTPDTQAMANGLAMPSEADEGGVLQFDEHENHTPANNLAPSHDADIIPDENHLHPRSAKAPSRITTTIPPDAPRNTRRKGRESSGFAYSANPLPGASSGTAERWNHDLHDLLENDGPTKQTLPIVEDIQRRNLPMNSSSAKGSEPLSRTVTIGHIALRVSLPGMSQPIPYEKTPLRYHIRLPDLRPPLRRDKPVRVSLPYQPPRYIFPSVDRSFIFIPRAQRPNQQPGRRPFGSRRNSIFGGSSYSPSVAMSRRSSVAREGIMSPATAAMVKPPFGAPTNQPRPVVKLPAGARPTGITHNGFNQLVVAPTDGISEQMYPPPGKPAYQSQWTGQLPVHQPRPQKTVSVTNIESPTAEKLHAPQQHESQPFHHQVPNSVGGAKAVPEQPPAYAPYGTSNPTGLQQAGTPAHLPDNAVNAQPFQPDPSAMYYSAPYAMQDMMYYPTSENGSVSYPTQPIMAPQMYVQPTMHGSYLVPMINPPAVPSMAPLPEAPPGMTAYEQNGTVYFYDANQYRGGNDNNGNTYSSSGANPAPKSNANGMFYPPNNTNYYS